ncbi:M14 family metallopeptidase [Ethanoligenens harbinense]|uniref:Peptidase M14 carboxypeptidase A n=1 Tax=Ethanoligenens harbinense (strain DSM 18485 / JCM 12961 / CGMCC 1.5033 / YUAN-3) TaxID=663278 RepID=E6U3Q9_ETHHY|nr:M14 family metallocarboxypeptidase [Ethanoligenens harbinense]ADU26476.1 peptidase M14 carboxypeptidase A [Ethanoligenens harbinense YUAN-3]
MAIVFNDRMPFGTSELREATHKLQERYASLRTQTIGESVLGRPLFLYLLGQGPCQALYVGGVHALEYITSMLLVRFTERLCACAETGGTLHGLGAASFLSNHALAVLPMLNPDGVEIHLHGAQTAGAAAATVMRLSGGDFSTWQANARGVDLNHNFDAGFRILKQQEAQHGIHGPGPGKFGGYRPESEAETRALCHLCRRIPFKKTIAFHSQGEELYWHYGPKTPPEACQMAMRLGNSAGYAVKNPTGMAAHGGFKDWFIQTFARPGFTVEVGKGHNPLPPENCPVIYEKLEPMMVLGLQV